MQNIRNKKRLTGLVLAFLLVFVVGSAFAFTPGFLDIIGRVNLQTEGYVVWYSVANTQMDNPLAPIIPPGPPPPGPGTFGTPIGSLQFAQIVNRTAPAPNLTNQRIEWDMYFVTVGSVPGLGAATEHRARLTATARNLGSLTAEIDTASVTWQTPAGAPLDPSDFGLTVVIDQAMFSGAANQLAPGGVSMPLQVDVLWDGTLPSGFGPGAIPTDPAQVNWPVAFAARLIIVFDYDPV